MKGFNVSDKPRTCQSRDMEQTGKSRGKNGPLLFTVAGGGSEDVDASAESGSTTSAFPCSRKYAEMQSTIVRNPYENVTL